MHIRMDVVSKWNNKYSEYKNQMFSEGTKRGIYTSNML
jgi:hypothetical protein